MTCRWFGQYLYKRLATIPAMEVIPAMVVTRVMEAIPVMMLMPAMAVTRAMEATPGRTVSPAKVATREIATNPARGVTAGSGVATLRATTTGPRVDHAQYR